MHTMLWVLFLYALVVIALLLIFFIITSMQKKDKENSITDQQLDDNESLHSEIDNEEANIRTYNEPEPPTLTADTTDTIDSPNDF